MFRKCLVIVFLFFILSILQPDVAFALGGSGFRNEVVSARGMGRGSANAAQTDDPAAVHYNPAAIVHLKDSYVSLGYTIEAPKAICNVAGGQEVTMQHQSFFIPNFYLVDNFGLKNFAFGLGVTVPYGLGTDWAGDSFSRYISTESDMEIQNINPTIAYKMNDQLSFGFGINYMLNNVDKSKKVNVTQTNTDLGAPGVEPDGNYQLKGDDDGWGYNVGFLYSPSGQDRIGVSYRSEVDFTYTGVISMDNLGVGATAATFGSSYSTNIKSGLTLPQSVAVGYAREVNDRLTIEADVEWTGWSSVEQDLIEWEDETNAVRLAILNAAPNPAPKDWDDVLAYAIGLDYKATDKMALRCGYLFEEGAIPGANFDTALPDSDRYGISFGMGYEFKAVTIDASYLALFFEDRSVSNNVGQSSAASLDGEYEQSVNIFAIGFTYKY